MDCEYIYTPLRSICSDSIDYKFKKVYDILCEVSTSGYSGYSGYSGRSGFSGKAISGFSGYSSLSGFSGYSSVSGFSGYSSVSGFSGYSGSGGSPGFKVYKALLTQIGTDAPVATVLENTLGGTVVWSYISVGVYRGTLAGAFTDGKTLCLSNGDMDFDGNVRISQLQSNINIDLTTLYTYDSAGAPVDVFGYLSVSIEVYP